MAKSTIWFAYEKNGKDISPLVKSLNKALSQKIGIPAREDEFEYSINQINEEQTEDGKNFYLIKLLKYRKTKKLETFDPTENKLSDESVKNYPLLEYSLFAVYKNWIFIEEKIPHMGHKQILKTIINFHSKVSKKTDDFSFEFKFSQKEVKEFIEQIDKILLVRFSGIGKNPDPQDENLRLFEELTGDTKAAAIEISNSKEGIPKNSKYIRGGFTLVKEGKAQMKIEAIKENEPKIFNTRKGRSKEKEPVEYDKLNRRVNILKKLKALIKSA